MRSSMKPLAGYAQGAGLASAESAANAYKSSLGAAANYSNAATKAAPGITSSLAAPVTESAAGAAASAAPGAGSPWLRRGAMAGGAGALGLGAYGLGKNVQEGQDKSKRNLAFGAGAATGLAIPGLLRGAANTAQNVALSPSSLFGGY